MWIHESFANYAEGLYTECQDGKAAGAEYIIGSRRNIANDSPIVGPHGVNAEGSSDMYYKGGSMLHTIRQIVNDDARWRGILRGLNRTFWHQTVTGRQVQDYISKQAGINLSKVFQQYLTTTMIPMLEYRLDGQTLAYRWANVIPGFDMPVRVTTADSSYAFIKPTAAWKTMRVSLSSPAAFKVDENFYVTAKDMSEVASPGR
jgi:aminopeptidase N